MNPFLSPKELAQTLGVSESSLKRWIDEGLLEAVRTPGGHRRIAVREAIRYIRQTGLTVVDPQFLGLMDLKSIPAETADPDAAIVDALKKGQAERTRGHVLAHYLGGRSVAAICDGPLRTALYDVGDLWRHDPQGIYIEHRTLDLCFQAIELLRSVIPPPAKDASVALGGSLEDDTYSLPTLMVATVLSSVGWRAVNLGPHLPISALMASVKDYQPSLVWMSCSTDEAARAHEKELRKAAATLKTQGRMILIGGRAWRDHRWEPQSGVTAALSMAEVAAFAQGLRAGHGA